MKALIRDKEVKNSRANTRCILLPVSELSSISAHLGGKKEEALSARRVRELYTDAGKHVPSRETREAGQPHGDLTCKGQESRR